jgi:hypothetical protein
VSSRFGVVSGDLPFFRCLTTADEHALMSLLLRLEDAGQQTE